MLCTWTSSRWQQDLNVTIETIVSTYHKHYHKALLHHYGLHSQMLSQARLIGMHLVIQLTTV
jgi:hypothetical protein